MWNVLLFTLFSVFVEGLMRGRNCPILPTNPHGNFLYTSHLSLNTGLAEEGVLRKRNLLLLEMSYSNHRKRNGMDYRHISNSTQHMDELHRIYRIFQIDKTLQILRNPAIPDHIKLDLIEKHGISPANISAGGLMDDFNGIDF